MEHNLPSDVTRLLQQAAGHDSAIDKLLPLLYHELHDAAERTLRGERPDHTLQPTALVNEAYLRLARHPEYQWQNRSHFIGVAATLMRRILVDHARNRQAQKRGGQHSRIALDEADAGQGPQSADLQALDEALHRLAGLDPRQARIVELRYFGGLTIEETAGLLDLSPATVKREWTTAKAWLRREIEKS